jgi:hypothetical protein
MVLGNQREKDLLLLFHPDKQSSHTDGLWKAQLQLGRTHSKPVDLLTEAFRRVMAAKGSSPRPSLPGNAAPANGPAPPPLEAFYVDIVPTVGDFGFDLIASFRIGAGKSSQVQEVIVGIFMLTKHAEWRTTNFLQGGASGEQLIQNQALVDKLGRRGSAKTAQVSACTSSHNGRSRGLGLQIDLTKIFGKVRLHATPQ